jgi:hypothetical protein
MQSSRRSQTGQQMKQTQSRLDDINPKQKMEKNYEEGKKKAQEKKNEYIKKIQNTNVIFSNGMSMAINIILLYLFVYTWYNKDSIINKTHTPIPSNMRNFFVKKGWPILKETKGGFLSGKKWYYIKNSLIIILFITYHIFFTANISASKCNGSQQWGPSITIVLVNFVIYIGLLILVLDKLPGFFQPFSNIIGYTIIISPILRQLFNTIVKYVSWLDYIPLTSPISTLLLNTTKNMDEKLFDIHDILKTLLLNPKDGGDIIDKILEDPSIFINNLSHHDVEKVIEKLKTDKRKIIKTKSDWEKEIQEGWDEEDKIIFEDKNNNIVKNLKKTLKFRDSISYFIWLIIGVSLFMSSNKTNISNLNICKVDKSISEIYKKIEEDVVDDIDESNKKIAADFEKTGKDIEKDL